MSEDPEGPVSVRIVFDRFPASVRGAVVVRGTDREPHQIRMLGADVVAADPPHRRIQEVGIDKAVVDVVPHGEVLIPFDIPFAGLEKGAYSVNAEVLVDGSTNVPSGEGSRKRFSVR